MENQYLDSNIDREVTQFSAYGGFWRRFVAVLIDGLLLGVVNSILQSISGVGSKIKDIIGDDPSDLDISAIMSVAGPMWALGFAIQLCYYAYFESSAQQATLGKQAMGLIVTDLNGNRISFGTAAVRFLSKILSGLIMGIGFLMQPFTARKQALHDMIAGTLVYKK
jgi:uncharacterized RDD family membrane protein YckC